MKQKLEKWVTWIKRIETEAITLKVFHSIKGGLTEIIEHNESIQRPSLLYDFIFYSYSSWAVMTIRRLIKKQNGSISLTELLEDIRDNPEILSRTNFKSLYSPPATEWADTDFDRAIGEPGLIHIKPEAVEDDLAKLKEVSDLIETFADRSVAHIDKRELSKAPTWDDLDRCVLELERIVLKYRFLLTGLGPLEHLATTTTFAWKAVLEEPWIKRKHNN